MLRRILPLCLALLMLMSSASLADVTPKGEFPIVNEPFTLDLAVVINPRIEDMNTNKFSVYTEETTGIDLNFIALPASDTMTKVNLMFASNDLPDAFTLVGFSYLNLIDYSASGQIVCLDDYIEEYGDQWQRVLDIATNPHIERMLRLPDGHIYSVFSCVESASNAWNNRIWLYEPWLKELGMEMPKTLDDLRALLVAIRDGDLNGNGSTDDEIPMLTFLLNLDPGNLISYFGNSFQYTDQNTFLDLNDGVVSFIAGNDAYRDTITFLRSLVEDNLLDPTSFTQDMTQMRAIIAGDEATVGVVPFLQKSAFADVTSERGRGYVIVPPLVGPDGFVTTTTGLAGVGYSYEITSKCENPAAAFRLGDFWLGEEASMYGRYGERGVEWDWADEGAVGNNGQPAYFKIIEDVGGMAVGNAVWYSDTRAVFLNVHDRLQSTGDPYEYNYQLMVSSLNDYAPVAKEEFLPPMNMSEEDSARRSELMNDILTYVKENSVRFIVGDCPLDEWDAYVAEFDALGVSEYVAMTQRVYDDFMAD